jgi:hypothetical protein
MWFACKRLRPNQVSAISAHEESRLEATLAGFDIRSPRGASAGVTVCTLAPKQRAVCPLSELRARENLAKAPLATGTSVALPRCARSALGAQWGDRTSVDATPPSAWRWRARSMTRKPGPPCCTWRRFGFVWQAKGTCQTRRKNAVRARRECLPRRSPWRASPRPAPFPA